MRFSPKIVSCFSLLFLLFAGCKKETVNDTPEITINSPTEGLQYSVGDTINVDISLVDDEGLAQYSVALCDAALIPVQQGVGSSSLSGSAANIQFYYPITNAQLTDGVYYLLVTVTDDAGSVARKYRSIYVTGIPKVRRGFFLVSAPNIATVNVSKVDSAWNVSSFAGYSSDYTSSDINSYRQQLYVCGKQTGLLRAISLSNGSTAWSQTPLPGPSDHFTNARFMGDYLFVSYRDNRLQGYDYTGTLRIAADVTNGFYPIRSLWSNNRMYAEQQDPGGPAGKLVVYNGSTGAGLQEAPLPLDVTELFEKDAGNIYVIGNAGSQGKLMIYDYSANGLWEPIALPAGKVLSAAQVDGNTLLIGMDNGNVYKFTYNPIALLTHIPGVNAQKLRFDPLESEVAAAQGNALKIYDYSSSILERTVLNTDSIADVHVWYNR